jgi:hypothetical protein
MTTATALPTNSQAFPLKREQYLCINENCGSEIPSHHVFRKIDRDHPTRRTVKAYCHHCDTVYQCRQILINGEWQADGAVEILHTKKDREGVMVQVAKLRGDVQIESLSA